jgi:hypothetical protein
VGIHMGTEMRDPFYMSWRAQMPGRPDPIDPEYLDTPYLTVAVNLCTAFGLFVGAWVLIYLLVDLRHGFAKYWWLVLILVIDLAVNVAVRVARARHRHALAPPPEPPPSGRRFERGPQRG